MEGTKEVKDSNGKIQDHGVGRTWLVEGNLPGNILWEMATNPCPYWEPESGETGPCVLFSQGHTFRRPL
jgi:hypothetical protein